jgi:hypothetical protein
MTADPKHKPPRRKPGTGTGPRKIAGEALDVRSTAALLGGTELQTRGLISRELIPYRRLGGRIIVLRAELEAFLAGLPGVTAAEAAQNAAARRSEL